MKTKIEMITEEVSNCPIYKTIVLFQGKWTVWVLFELNKHESVRFGELRKAIPNISNTMLTATLKELEDRGLVERVQYNEIPPRVEYTATEKAKDLNAIFEAMAIWGQKHCE